MSQWSKINNGNMPGIAELPSVKAPAPVVQSAKPATPPKGKSQPPVTVTPTVINGRPGLKISIKD